MKISLNYGNKIITLPGKLNSKLLLKASQKQLAALIFVSSKNDVELLKDSSALKMTVEEFVECLNFWRDNNILTFESTNEILNSQDSENRPLKASASELPDYSTKDVTNYLENNRDAKSLIECCSQILGKTFNTAEIKKIIGMLDYLALKPDYIALLCDYCVNINKKSIRYIELTALSLVDSGITEYSELEELIEKKKKSKDIQKEICDILGIKDRNLIEQEKECFYQWVIDWGYSIEVIKKAYEICIANTGKYSIKYVHKIIENWHNNGYASIKDINDAQESYTNTKKASQKGSFNTDDFFSAALRKTYSKKGD